MRKAMAKAGKKVKGRIRRCVVCTGPSQQRIGRDSHICADPLCHIAFSSNMVAQSMERIEMKLDKLLGGGPPKIIT